MDQDIVVLSDGSDDIVCVGSSSQPSPARHRPSFTRTTSLATTVHAFGLSDDERSDDDLDAALSRRLETRSGTSSTSAAGPSTSARKRKALGNSSHSLPPPAGGGQRSKAVKATRSALVTVDKNQGYGDRRSGTGARCTIDDFEEEETPAEKAARKEAEKKEKAAQKEAEKQERWRAREEAKEKEKAQKKFDREAAKVAKEAEKSRQKKLADANRLRVSKVDCLREIELHMAHDLSLPSSPIAGAMQEVRLRLEENKSSIQYLSPEESTSEGTIKFLRRTKAVWDASQKRFNPLDHERVEWEPTLVVVTSVDAIVDRIAESDSMFLEWLSDIRLTATTEPSDQVFLLVRGLAKYHSKTVSIGNRAYRDTVSARLHDGDARGARPTGRRVTKEMVETHLLRAQVKEHVFVVLVDETEEIEDWLYNLAADVAFRPYKRLTKSHLAFSAPEGQRKGLEPGEVLRLMLQEVPGVTAAAADGVSSAGYGSLRELMEGYEEIDERDGESMLQGCSIGTLATGVASSRQIGAALSKKMCEILRGDDPLALL